ncbi:hypothetical protein KSP40_PGU017764 [Platanthera guangdongensis]|uniref:Uncharacterized protein n=1 Tax=Platanthera guangdongensis TaxID=2320717 RepID=A0ABR2MRQ1_9ASPA
MGYVQEARENYVKKKVEEEVLQEEKHMKRPEEARSGSQSAVKLQRIDLQIDDNNLRIGRLRLERESSD